MSPVSPLAGYLSPGDIIMSLNDLDIHNPEEWFEKVAHLDTQMQNRSYYSGYSDSSMSNGKGYCVPNSWVEERGILSTDDEIACPDGLVAFKTMPCCRHFLGGNDCDVRYRNSTKRKDYCFPPQDVVKFKKCGDGCQMTTSNQSCECLQVIYKYLFFVFFCFGKFLWPWL